MAKAQYLILEMLSIHLINQFMLIIALNTVQVQLVIHVYMLVFIYCRHLDDL